MAVSLKDAASVAPNSHLARVAILADGESTLTVQARKDLRREESAVSIKQGTLLQRARLQHIGVRAAPVRIITISRGLGTLFYILLIAAIMLFVVYGRYARKETVDGIVSPADGSLIVVAPRSGVVEKLLVAEGDRIQKGQTLAVIKANAVVESGENLAAMLGEAIEAESRALLQRSLAEDMKYDASLGAIKQQRQRLERDAAIIDETDRLFESRLVLAQKDVAVFQQLFAEGAESAMRLRATEANVLELRISRQQLETKRADLERESQRLLTQELQLQAGRSEIRSDIQRRDAELAEKRANLSGNSAVLLRAETDGRISALNVRAGNFVSPGATIATILPQGIDLEARIWLPSRSMGFVGAGDEVRVMYDAFPFHHFGLATGRVSRVSASPTDVKDLPPELNSKEPLYLATVALARQTVTRGGESWPIRPGMRLKADIVLESRTLLDWLLVPFQDWKRRQSGALDAV
jgi:membrane fusion protein